MFCINCYHRYVDQIKRAENGAEDVPFFSSRAWINAAAESGHEACMLAVIRNSTQCGLEPKSLDDRNFRLEALKRAAEKGYDTCIAALTWNELPKAEACDSLMHAIRAGRRATAKLLQKWVSLEFAMMHAALTGNRQDMRTLHEWGASANSALTSCVLNALTNRNLCQRSDLRASIKLAVELGANPVTALKKLLAKSILYRVDDYGSKAEVSARKLEQSRALNAELHWMAADATPEDLAQCAKAVASDPDNKIGKDVLRALELAIEEAKKAAPTRRRTHKMIIEAALALHQLNVPPYVLLWILNMVDPSEAMSQQQRIALILSVRRSIASIKGIDDGAES